MAEASDAQVLVPRDRLVLAGGLDRGRAGRRRMGDGPGFVTSLVPGVEEPRPSPADALADLRYIRRTMERATFTAVPGYALAAVGVLALVAAAASQWVLRAASGSDPWLASWAVAGFLSVLLVGWAFRQKARRHGVPGSARKLILGMGAPLLAVLSITIACRDAGVAHLATGVWLAGYGAGVLSAGAFSTRSIPALGAGCMALGIAAFLTPATWADAWLAAGFGVFHVVVGFRVARRHGG
jgi:hypothetical protein